LASPIVAIRFEQLRRRAAASRAKPIILLRGTCSGDLEPDDVRCMSGGWLWFPAGTNLIERPQQ
jgi:hypothetical protein